MASLNVVEKSRLRRAAYYASVLLYGLAFGCTIGALTLWASEVIWAKWNLGALGIRDDDLMPLGGVAALGGIWLAYYVRKCAWLHSALFAVGFVYLASTIHAAPTIRHKFLGGLVLTVNMGLAGLILAAGMFGLVAHWLRGQRSP